MKRKVTKTERRFAERVAKHKYGAELEFTPFSPPIIWVVEEVRMNPVRRYVAFETRHEAAEYVNKTPPGFAKSRVLGRYVWYVPEAHAPKKKARKR